MMTFATIAVLRAGFCDRGSCIYPKSVIKPTFQSISSFSGLFMPYQHFFMFHDVTWARQRKQASFALENNVAPIRSRRYFTKRSASCPHLCLVVPRYAFASDATNLLETGRNSRTAPR